MDENKKNIEYYINITRGCPEYEEYEAEKRNNCGCSNKLNAFDWLAQLPPASKVNDIVEVRFKNTRKGFYRNTNSLKLQVGDLVAVEANPGHDLGIISLTGELVYEQLRRGNISLNTELKKVYRKAKPVDIEKWHNSIQLEHDMMLRTRKIAEQLRLEMKIGDVEFQGDGTKAIFYYIADERVDFRELIKVLADEFKIRIEMRQIGARQEAGRIGGIGTCGRQLCCSTWITNFVSVTTNAARYQELSLNPQKLAGQCGKLKCCLNFELDCYMDAQKDFPQIDVPLDTKEGIAYHMKTDIFRRVLWYSFDPEASLNMTPVSVERVHEIQQMNKRGMKPKSLNDTGKQQNQKETTETDYKNAVDQDSISRFDDKKKKKHRKKNRDGNFNNPNPQQNNINHQKKEAFSSQNDEKK